MRLLDRYLLVLLTTLLLSAGLAYAPWRVSAREARRPVAEVPDRVSGWVGSRGAPSEVLPEDPRARETIRWTYRKGDRVMWVVVGVYESRNDPQTRPSIDRIVEASGASGLGRRVVPVGLEGAGVSTVPVNQVVVTRPTRRLSVFYWYQLGPKSIANEYRLRMALFLNTLVGTDERLALVRVATTAEPGPGSLQSGNAEPFLEVFYPTLMKTLGN